MTIELVTTDINKVYLGSTEIKKAYLGSTAIFDNTGGSPPASGWIPSDVAYNASGDLVVPSDDYPSGVTFFNNDNSLAVSTGETDSIVVWQLPTPGSTVGATRDSAKDYVLPNRSNDIRFKPDDSEMYTLEYGRYLKTYSITGADPSTASNLPSREFDFFATNIQGFDISPDGTIVVICSTNGSLNLRWFETSTPWDFSLLTEDASKGLDIDGGNFLALYGVKFGNSGNILTIADKSIDKIRYFDLVTPYDIAGMTEDVSKAKDVSLEEIDVQGVDWNADGSKMVIVGWSSNSVKLYE